MQRKILRVVLQALNPIKKGSKTFKKHKIYVIKRLPTLMICVKHKLLAIKI